MGAVSIDDLRRAGLTVLDGQAVRIPNHKPIYEKTNTVVAGVQVPVMERALCHGTLSAPETATCRRPRVRARITSFTRRPVDDCNLSTKALVDCLRYAGLIVDDNWSNLEVVGQQKKVEHESGEGTLIEIEEI